MKVTHLVLLVLFLSGALLFSQEAGTEGRIPTIEELYLENPSLIAVVEQANSTDRDTRLLALDDIETLLKAGEIAGNEDELLSVLDFLVSDGTDRVVLEANRQVNNFPMVRRKSAELMGLLGRDATDPDIIEQAQESLVDVLLRDNEVMVKAEAAYALGIVGKDETGDILQVLSDVIHRQSTLAPDDNFAYAVTLAIDKIANDSASKLDYHAYTALVTIMQGNYTRMVKDKALEVMQNLKKNY